jgi:hypothetical protein
MSAFNNARRVHRSVCGEFSDSSGTLRREYLNEMD